MKEHFLTALFCLTVLLAFVIFMTARGASSRDDCNETGKLINRTTVTVAGQCWVKLDHGITLPLPDAIEMMKFTYTKEEMKQPLTEDQKIEKVEHVREQIVLKDANQKGRRR